MMTYDGHTPAPELELKVRTAAAPVHRVTASYLDADWVEKQFGTTPVLTIGVTNTGVEPTRRDDLLREIGNLGWAWLRDRSLLRPGTMIAVTLHREIDLTLISFSWGKGGRVFWIDDAGALTTEEPRAAEPS